MVTRRCVTFGRTAATSLYLSLLSRPRRCAAIARSVLKPEHRITLPNRSMSINYYPSCGSGCSNRAIIGIFVAPIKMNLLLEHPELDVSLMTSSYTNGSVQPERPWGADNGHEKIASEPPVIKI